MAWRTLARLPSSRISWILSTARGPINGSWSRPSVLTIYSKVKHHALLGVAGDTLQAMLQSLQGKHCPPPPPRLERSNRHHLNRAQAHLGLDASEHGDGTSGLQHLPAINLHQDGLSSQSTIRIQYALIAILRNHHTQPAPFLRHGTQPALRTSPPCTLLQPSIVHTSTRVNLSQPPSLP